MVILPSSQEMFRTPLPGTHRLGVVIVVRYGSVFRTFVLVNTIDQCKEVIEDLLGGPRLIPRDARAFHRGFDQSVLAFDNRGGQHANGFK